MPESNLRETAGTSLTIADPTDLYRPAELDCDGGGQTIVDLAGSAPTSSPEEALKDLLSDDALADHDIEGAGYPEVDIRPYVVRQDGRTVAVAGFRAIGPDEAVQPDAPPTVSGGPFGYVLVELTACADALRHR